MIDWLAGCLAAGLSGREIDAAEPEGKRVEDDIT